MVIDKPRGSGLAKLLFDKLLDRVLLVLITLHPKSHAAALTPLLRGLIVAFPLVKKSQILSFLNLLCRLTLKMHKPPFLIFMTKAIICTYRIVVKPPLGIVFRTFYSVDQRQHIQIG